MDFVCIPSTCKGLSRTRHPNFCPSPPAYTPQIESHRKHTSNHKDHARARTRPIQCARVAFVAICGAEAQRICWQNTLPNASERRCSRAPARPRPTRAHTRSQPAHDHHSRNAARPGPVPPAAALWRFQVLVLAGRVGGGAQ